MTRPRQIVPLFVAACCLVGIGGVIFTNQTAIAKQLQDWQLLPQPEGLSELYFTDHTKLPKVVAAGSAQPITFTVHNLEHRATTYHYKVIATLQNTTTPEVLGEGTFTLEHDKSQVTQTTIAVPALGPRLSLGVALYYKNAAPGSTEALQTQSINQWVAVSGLSADRTTP